MTGNLCHLSTEFFKVLEVFESFVVRVLLVNPLLVFAIKFAFKIGIFCCCSVLLYFEFKLPSP